VRWVWGSAWLPWQELAQPRTTMRPLVEHRRVAEQQQVQQQAQPR
jgi:hypothetical protein